MRFQKITATALLALLFISACGSRVQTIPTRLPPTPEATLTPPAPEENQTPEAPQEEEFFHPGYYAPGYADIIQASKQEADLVIYSSVAETHWAALIQAFNEHYPWIKVTIRVMEAGEVFPTYYKNMQSNIRTADLIVTSDPAGWQTFFKDGYALNYISQEEAILPAWAKPELGIYTLSSDPMLLVYNREKVANPPTSMAALGELARNSPETYTNQIVTHDAAKNLTGLAANWFWLDFQKDTGWSILADIGVGKPATLPSDEEIITAVSSGQFQMGYFVSASAIFSSQAGNPSLGWSYLEDGQPILLRNVAINSKGLSQNSAKLLLDYILSQEGQIALAMGGLTAYRADISSLAAHHINEAAEVVGIQNLIFFNLDPRLANQQETDTFTTTWEQTLQIVTPTLTPSTTPTLAPTPTATWAPFFTPTRRR